jgi:hypothetical protein
METKWCVSCQVLRPANSFKLVKTGKATRWKCGVCLKHEAERKYGK